MARASKIYVMCREDRTPIATFTVKHEAKKWLSENKKKPNFEVKWVAVYPDGECVKTIPVWDVRGFLDDA